MIEIIKQAYDDYKFNKNKYDRMHQYYIGNTDTMNKYVTTDRSNLKASVNFLKKFINTQVSYTLGNPVNYISKSGKDDIINDLYYYTNAMAGNHDINLLRTMLLYGVAYEIFYIDKNNEFNAKVISPRNGFAIVDDFGNVELFGHVFSKGLNKKTYIDIYSENAIYHFDEQLNQISEPTSHIFGTIPVSVCRLSEEQENDTIYKDIKQLQDCYENVLSDQVNEIADMRQSYMVLTGVQLDEQQAKEMKKMGIIQIKDKSGSAEWLIKNLSSDFIKSSLDNLEDKIYQVTNMINFNEKLQSNLSGVALRSRLAPLEQVTKITQKTLEDCLKRRIRCLFVYLKVMYDKNYDYRDVSYKFTINVPIDDLTTSQMISQLGDKLSTETALSLLSFIENPKNELAKRNREQENIIEGSKLLEDDLDE